MSVNQLLTMQCSIERSTPVKDEYENTILSWTVIKTGVRCFTNYIENTVANIRIGVSGESISDLFMGFFLPDEDIKSGDRISLNGVYYYIRSSNKMWNPKKATNSHIECLLSTEET
jgi:hypothetical protein